MVLFQAARFEATLSQAVLSQAAPVAQVPDNCMTRNEWVCPAYLTSRADLLTAATWQHLWLTLVSVIIGLVLALPLSLLARRYPNVEFFNDAATTEIYTIPSL